MNYLSSFKKYIEELIQEKQATGYLYEASAKKLKFFDSFCRKYYPKEKILTKKIAMHWAERRNNEKINNIHRRVTPVSQLAKYINSIGSFYPGVSWVKRPGISLIFLPSMSFLPFFYKPTSASPAGRARQGIL